MTRSLPKRLRVIVGSILLMTGLAGAALAESVRLRADYWCPFNCDPEDEHPGYMIEIAKLAMARLGMAVDYQLMPWDRAMSEVRSGSIDGAVGATTLEADALVLSDPLGVDRDCFFATSVNSWRFTGVESLRSILLGAVSGYVHDEGAIDAYIAANDVPSGQVSTTKGDDASARNIRLLLLGRIDAILDSQAVVAMEISRQGQARKIIKVGCLEALPLYIAFSPKRANALELAAAVNQEVDELRKSGRLAEILSHYGLEDWQQ